MANNIRLCHGVVEGLAYWTFTDAMFEEGGPFRSPFQGPSYLNRDKGGFGLIATHNIPKAGFNALQLLHRLGDRRIPLDSNSAILTKSSATKNLALALWNYSDPEVEGERKSFRMQLANPEVYKQEATIQVVDETRGNAVRRWNLMGSPQFPTLEQISELQRAAMLPAPETISLQEVINLDPHALALLEIFHV
jgi:xylan 1,4-beta-xylosidase